MPYSYRCLGCGVEVKHLMYEEVEVLADQHADHRLPPLVERYICDNCTEHQCALVGPFVLRPGQTECVCCDSTDIRRDEPRFIPDPVATAEIHRRMAELDPQVRNTVKRATRLLADKYEGALRRLADS